MDKSQLITAIKSRTGRTGLLTADRYVRSVLDCVAGQCINIGGCPDEWQKAVREAENKLTHSHPDMTLKVASGVQIEKAVLVFDCNVTTPKRDRDRDVLETKGGILDPRAPLLFNHMTINTTGVLVSELSRTESVLPARCAIADTAFGRDMAVLTELGALRISHGFDPLEFEPLKDEGWYIKKFEIYEISLVPIPSNTDAVITAFSRGKLHEPLVKAWAEKKFRRRVKVHPVGVSFKQRIGDIEQEFTAPDHDELKLVIAASMPDESCACHKAMSDDDERDEDMEMLCPKCGYKGPHSAFMPDDEEKSIGYEHLVAVIATADIHTIKDTHRQLGLVITALEDQQAAREAEALLEALGT